MKFSLSHSISIEQRRESSSDEMLVVLQQIALRWPDAVLDRNQQPIPISELVTLPEGQVFIVYRDRSKMFEHRRFDGAPDSSCWIRVEWLVDRLVFVVDAWSSASGRVVREILEIDR